MDTLERLLAYLTSNQVQFTHDVHPVAYTAADIAGLEHVPAREFAKTVVVKTETGYAMAVLPADAKVSLEDLRGQLGAHYVRLATEHELDELFHGSCELGAMPPFGNGTLFELPVYLDAHLAAEEEIAFNGGTHHDAIRMPYRDYERLVKPAVLHFAGVAAAH